MSRQTILTKISRWMHKDVALALDIAGVNEHTVVRYVHKWKAEADGEIICTFIKTLVPLSRKIVKVWVEHTPEHWKQLRLMGTVFPELTLLNKLKKEMRSVWYKRLRVVNR